MLPDIMLRAAEGDASIASGFTTALNEVWSMFGTCIGTFNSNPILWLGTAFGAAGAIVGLVKRSTSVGRRRR